MRFISFLFFIMVFSNSYALETDNYIVWDRELEDSSEEINSLFKREIDSVLSKVNHKSKTGKNGKTGNKAALSCRKLTFKIARRFNTYPPLKIFIEDWLIANLSKDKIYPSHMNYISDSIYKNSYGFFFKRIPLSPNIQVNNIYFGTDKLSHFSSTSRSYLKKYLKSLDNGLRNDQALKNAIDLGILKENTILGLKFIGVFSYGDLEANYQGLKFYYNLCLSDTPYLKVDRKGRWVVSRYPDIVDYVNPNWDESFNLSYRSNKNWFRTSHEIVKTYCPLFDSERVQKRREYYQSILRPSFSSEYIHELQVAQSSRTPNPLDQQSLEALCKSIIK